MIVRSLLMAIAIATLLPTWYTDVPDNYTYRDAIWYMTTASYASGYSDNTFKPDNPLTRAEALKMILVSSAIEIQSGGDNWFDPYINTALNLEIISGYPDGDFKPSKTVNRAEALKMLLKARGVEIPDPESGDWYKKYLDYATENALIADFAPDGEISRGEMSEIIHRLHKNIYTGEVEYGGATWYGGKFEGEGTASGDTYDGSQLTAAHKTLPFGTMVKVTNPANNLSVTVRINDRGPYRDGYVIDLSSAAFEKIANLSTGVLNVRVERQK
ncbi:septal ring lytic transglycosylase RlpA family protein [Candidatus Peregrinibacteria bacterium]|nr:septal ring lytic transglycosylase RlpA family protein [Candidatus Peregrinibacteria bacterium]